MKKNTSRKDTKEYHAKTKRKCKEKLCAFAPSFPLREALSKKIIKKNASRKDTKEYHAKTKRNTMKNFAPLLLRFLCVKPSLKIIKKNASRKDTKEYHAKTKRKCKEKLCLFAPLFPLRETLSKVIINRK